MAYFVHCMGLAPYHLQKQVSKNCLPGRVTYIVDKSGKVVDIFNSQSRAKRHVDEAIKILKGLEVESKKENREQ